jgi:hypothetical protein
MATVIRVGNLEEFTAEIPIPRAMPGSPIEPRPPVVRLSLTELVINRSTGSLPSKRIELHLQALNDQGQIIWLMEQHRIGCMPNGEPLSSIEASISEGMGLLHKIVGDHLRGLGYDVRPGSFGLPKNIEPVSGHFECAIWRKNGDDRYTVVVPEVAPPDEDPQGEGAQ